MISAIAAAKHSAILSANRRQELQQELAEGAVVLKVQDEKCSALAGKAATDAAGIKAALAHILPPATSLPTASANSSVVSLEAQAVWTTIEARLRAEIEAEEAKAAEVEAAAAAVKEAAVGADERVLTLRAAKASAEQESKTIEARYGALKSQSQATVAELRALQAQVEQGRLTLKTALDAVEDEKTRVTAAKQSLVVVKEHKQALAARLAAMPA